MKRRTVLKGVAAVVLAAAVSCGYFVSSYPAAPGTLFIRQQICDLNDFKKGFLGHRKELIEVGFSGYSLHRDLKDPKTYLLTLRCSNLKKAVHYIQSSDFHRICVGAGLGIPVIWAGEDVVERRYADEPHMTGGIVIAKNQVRDYDFWKACFDHENGGKHNHPGRNYKPSAYSIHRLKGKPEVVLVVHEASDVAKAPAFMNSAPMKGAMEAAGVTGLEVWYGVNLEEGVF